MVEIYSEDRRVHSVDFVVVRPWMARVAGWAGCHCRTLRSQAIFTWRVHSLSEAGGQMWRRLMRVLAHQTPGSSLSSSGHAATCPSMRNRARAIRSSWPTGPVTLRAHASSSEESAKASSWRSRLQSRTIAGADSDLLWRGLPSPGVPVQAI